MPYSIPEGISRYLYNLYSRFDKEPDGIPVLRIDDRVSGAYAEGGYIRLQNFSLTIVPASNSSSHRVEIDLTQASSIHLPYLEENTIIHPTITIIEVHDILEAAGFQVSEVDPRFNQVSATILSEMDEGYDGRSFLSVATSVLWRVLVPIALEGKNEKEQVGQAIKQFDLRIADSIWLDRIGDLYGLSRYEDEDDELFRRRIDYYVIRPHVNNQALSNMIDSLFEYSNTITDTFSPSWFYTDDLNSVSYTAGLTDIRYTTEGQSAAFTVTINESLPRDTMPDKDIYKESKWFYSDDPMSVAADGLTAIDAKTSAPGVDYVDTLLENKDLLLIDPQQAGRKLWRAVAEYKAAGTRFDLRFPHVIQTKSVSNVAGTSSFPQTVTIVGTTTRIVRTEHTAEKTFTYSSTSKSPTASSYPQSTKLISKPIINGSATLYERILSYN